MGKYFGTDGIRGVANETLDARLAYLTGFAAAVAVGGRGGRPRAIIGKDTRVSSDMLEAALISGLCSGGADASPLGVLPTPAVAYLVRETGADMGIVISASHNPYEHNGIKIFDARGFKLSDALEGEIERLIDSPAELRPRTRDGLGCVKRDARGETKYIEHLAGLSIGAPRGVKIAADCANGAASFTARRLFRALGAEASLIHCKPNGLNINLNCGSTHMDSLRRAVTRGGFDIGFAFDGDADRCLIIDELGGLIDGDVILAVCARDMKSRGELRNNAVVGTVLSNSGLDEFGRREGFRVLRSDVGDRSVLEMMLAGGARLGGESSGHTIFLDDSTTGDGQLAAVKFLNLLARTGKTASELARDVPRRPQVMVNIPAAPEEKERKLSSRELADAVEAERSALGGRGCVIVRPSGTESLIRVTAEAETEDEAKKIAERLAKLIREAT
ncbi:MAG: phosphoglucosamine mutase [Oscillospiraceae bacterium]|jgi:phosphoglucosamine mutase|nr:phosphoglucosamine mutase [Oscillospiraceae bacterium]